MFGFDHPKGGYGFHENTQPETTGDKVSHGCMRLYPEHAKKLRAVSFEHATLSWHVPLPG